MFKSYHFESVCEEMHASGSDADNLSTEEVRKATESIALSQHKLFWKESMSEITTRPGPSCYRRMTAYTFSLLGKSSSALRAHPQLARLSAGIKAVIVGIHSFLHRWCAVT